MADADYPVVTLEQAREWQANQATTTRCAWCDAVHVGTFESGRAWHAEHVAEAHLSRSRVPTEYTRRAHSRHR